jgi:hypothetical protein
VSGTTRFLLIGALLIICAVFGYALYLEKREAHGIGIRIDQHGVSVQKK